MARSLEHAYFASKNADRRQALREKLDDMAKTAVVAEHLGTDDKALAERIYKLGFEGEAAKVFDLTPLIHVAWADGSVQESERALVMAVLEKRGVEPGSPASVLIETLLEKKPSAEWLDESLQVVKVLRDRRGGGGNIVELCNLVAESAGGFLGLAVVSKEERELLAEIADTLGGNAVAAVERELAE